MTPETDVLKRLYNVEAILSGDPSRRTDGLIEEVRQIRQEVFDLTLTNAHYRSENATLKGELNERVSSMEDRADEIDDLKERGKGVLWTVGLLGGPTFVMTLINTIVQFVQG